MSISKGRIDQLDRRAKAKARSTRPAATPAIAPNIVVFATSKNFLGLDLYPAQATLLKVITLALELLTPFDHNLIQRWATGFKHIDDPDNPRYEGTEGISPDVYERINWCRDQRLPWFSQVALVIGRRGSKGLLSAILLLWRVYQLLLLDDPAAHYGRLRGKPVILQIYGANHDTAKRDVFGDIVALLKNAPCFAPFLGKTTSDTITFRTPSQLRHGAGSRATGVVQISAVPTTPVAGRGPAVPAAVLDEFAHVERRGDSSMVTRSLLPAMAQFKDRLLVVASSPWNKFGELFRIYERGLQIKPGTRDSKFPELLVVQLPSDGLYVEWQSATSIPMWPDGPRFRAVPAPPIDRETMDAECAIDPISGLVEYYAQFAAAVDAYLRPDIIRLIFGPWRGQPVMMADQGRLNVRYVAHADTSKVNDNFAFVIAHAEEVDGEPHIVIDVFKIWRPSEFPNHIIYYPQIQAEIFEYLTLFPISDLTFDQYCSVQMIQELKARVERAELPWPIQVYERTASPNSNWLSAETFKKAANLGLVHAPAFDQAQLELERLQVKGQRVAAPTSGPVTNDDCADCMFACTHTLLGDDAHELFMRLALLRPHGSLPGGVPLSQPAANFPAPVVSDPAAGLSAVGRFLGRRARERRIQRM